MLSIESCQRRVRNLLYKADLIMDRKLKICEEIPIKEYQKATSMYKEAATIMMTLKACSVKMSFNEHLGIKPCHTCERDTPIKYKRCMSGSYPNGCRNYTDWLKKG